MTADAPSPCRASPSPDGRLSLLAATVPEALAEQIDRILRDLAAQRWLADRGDALARGAALAAAHAALALATMPLSSQRERDRRRAALDGILPALARVGLHDVIELVAAALALDTHPVSLMRVWDGPQ